MPPSERTSEMAVENCIFHSTRELSFSQEAIEIFVHKTYNWAGFARKSPFLWRCGRLYWKGVIPMPRRLNVQTTHPVKQTTHRRRQLFMPKYSEPRELTPWAQVLTDFMWNQRSPRRPPLNVPQLAVRLGMPRQNVGAWIYRNVVPSFEIMMAVLARLNIPLRTLYDAYATAGLPMPAWDASAAATTPTPADEEELPEIPRRRSSTALPVEEIERRESIQGNIRGPEPLPYTPQPPRDLARELAEEWDTVIAQTAKSLRDAGMPQAMVDGAIAALRARQRGEDPFQRHIDAEHSEPDPDSAPHPAEQQPGRQPSGTNTRKFPDHARK